MRTFSTVIITLLVLVLLVLGALLIYVESGAYDVATAAEHTPIVRSLLGTMKERSIRTHADEVAVTVPTDSSARIRGYRAYEEMCVVCHGAPGVEKGWMGQGMNPEPPDLTRAAEEFTTEEIYWVLQNGIKLAGMPALEPTHDDLAILELTAFVESLADMTEAEYALLGRTMTDTTAVHDHAGHEH